MSAKRILVLLDPNARPAPDLAATFHREGAEVFIVTAVLPSRLSWLTNDDAAATGAAERRLDGALDTVRDAGVPAGGAVGADDDLLTVIDDALAEFADEIVIVGPAPGADRHWRIEGLAARVAERHAIDVRVLAVA